MITCVARQNLPLRSSLKIWKELNRSHRQIVKEKNSCLTGRVKSKSSIWKGESSYLTGRELSLKGYSSLLDLSWY